jgi:hypothetical protein
MFVFICESCPWQKCKKAAGKTALSVGISVPLFGTKSGRTSDTLIMSVKCAIPWISTDLYLFVPITFEAE